MSEAPKCPVCSFGKAIAPVWLMCVKRTVIDASYKCSRCSVELWRPERLPEGTSPGFAGVSTAFLAEAPALASERAPVSETAAAGE